MSSDEAFRILENVSQFQEVDHLAVHLYGETLLHPQVRGFVDRCRELGLRSHFVTNGLLLTEQNVQKVKSHSPDMFRISSQIINPEFHAKNRGSNVTFEKYIDQIAACLADLLDTNNDVGQVRTDIAFSDFRITHFV